LKIFFACLFPLFTWSQTKTRADSIKILLESHVSDSLTVKKCISLLERSADEGADIIKYYPEVMKLADKAKSFPEGRVEMRQLFVNVFYFKKEMVKAESIADEAIQIARLENAKGLEAAALYTKGNLFRLTGHFSQALNCYKDAEKLSALYGTPDEHAAIIYHVGVMYWRNNNTAAALSCFQKSADIFDSLNDKSAYSRSLLGMAVIYDEEKQRSKAIELYRRVSEVELAEKKFETASVALYNIGEWYFDESKIDSSLKYVERAIKCASKVHYPDVLIVGYATLGRIYSKKNQDELSEKYFMKSLALSRESKDKAGEAFALNLICELYSKKDDYSKMEKYIRQAIQINEEIGDSLQLKESYLQASTLYGKKRDFEHAYKFRILHDSLSQRAFNSENNRVVNEMLAKYEAKSKEKENERLQKENLMSARIISQQKLLFYLYLSGLPIGALLLFFIVRWYRLQNVKYELKVKSQEVELINLDRKNKIIEKERLQTELEFLRAQINPHFLFNALNSIYVLMDENRKLASDTLVKFSSLLRYQLYECSSDGTTIEKEIDFINNYISLEKIRNGENLEVVSEFSDSLGYARIAPFILIPFIENAFKHMSHFTDQLNRIEIIGWFADSIFHFKVLNTCDEKAQSHLAHKGIGLKNVKRRLELLYPRKHSLQIAQDRGYYSVFLSLQLDLTM
jgi:sensor histidine kinase YesM